MKHRLFDMHCHLDLMANAEEVACHAHAHGAGIVCTTVTPDGFAAARNRLGRSPGVFLGCGLHPWWLSDGRATIDDARRAAELAAREPIVGEIGLDFSPRRGGDVSRELQAEAFSGIVRACAGKGPKLLSIHAVRSASAALDILEDAGALGSCRCVFHWFTGTSDELARARRAGCYFSINEMMLSTRKGAEYARQLPEGSILLETDLPPRFHEPFDPAAYLAQLEGMLMRLAALRGTSPEELGGRIARTSARILCL